MKELMNDIIQGFLVLATLDDEIDEIIGLRLLK